MKKGRTADAKGGFSLATYSSPFRSAAYAKLSEIYLKEKNWTKAMHYALLSLDFNRMNLDARQVLMVVFRKTNQKDKALEQINLVLENLPLYHFARYEQHRIDDSLNMTHFSSLVRNELPWETFMELAGWYESVGCVDDALELLSCSQDYPIALYRKAYLLDRTGRKSESLETLQKANSLSPDKVFPFRSETMTALDWAASVSNDWKIKYYQGLVYWANQRKDKALELFGQCDHSSYGPFYLSRAKLKQQLPSKSKAPFLDDLLKAERLDMTWRTGLALLNAYTDEGNWTKVVQTGEKYIKKYPENYYIGLKLAKGYCEAGQYANCIQLLDRLYVLPNEGAYAGRSVYRAANLYQAMDYLKKGDYKRSEKFLETSMQWPENLGVGKPYDDQIDSRLEDYIHSKIYAKKGDTGKAGILLKKVADCNPKSQRFKSTNLLTALALRESGKQVEADKQVAAWKQAYPNDRTVEWCTFVYQGEVAQAATILNARADRTDSTPWETSRHDVDFDLIVRLVSN